MAVAAAQDREVLEAVRLAMDRGWLRAILVGDPGRIKELSWEVGLDPGRVEVLAEGDPRQAARRAAGLVRDGRAGMLMKGMVSTADFLRAVLDREGGLRTGRVLSHAAVLEVPGYDRLLMITDGGINVAPDLERKIEILENALDLARAMEIATPHVAVLSGSESVDPAVPSSVDAAELARLQREEERFGKAIVEGPLAFDVAVSRDAAAHKGIVARVAGETDILLVPSVEAGNSVAKALIMFGGAKAGGVVLGSAAPVMLLSRADTAETKLNCLALGAILSER